MWQERPLLGAGPDNFRHQYGRYAGLKAFDTRITANSFFFEVLSTLGLIGLAAWGWLAVALAIVVVRWWRLPHAGSVAAGVTIAAALAAFLLHGVVDYFLEFTPTYGLFWLIVGAGVRTWTGDAAHPRSDRGTLA
jgi:O-antigen ligase